MSQDTRTFENLTATPVGKKGRGWVNICFGEGKSFAGKARVKGGKVTFQSTHWPLRYVNEANRIAAIPLGRIAVAAISVTRKERKKERVRRPH